MMSIVFLSCVFIFLLFFSFLCQVGVYRVCLSKNDIELDLLAKELAFNSQILLVVSAGLSFMGQWGLLTQFVLLLVVPLFWFMKLNKTKVIRFIFLQIFFQYFFLFSFLSVYHFTSFAVEKGVFRPLPSYISLPVIDALDNEVKKVFVDF